MAGPLALLGAIPGIGTVVDKIIGRFVADKDAVESNHHDETMAVHGSAQAEWSLAAAIATSGKRSWFDIFVDCWNRLPRPVIVSGVVYLLCLAVVDPLGFTIAMQALSIVPEWLQMCIAGIIAFYFAIRSLEKARYTAPDPKAVQGVLSAIQGLNAQRAPKVREDPYSPPSAPEPVRTTDDIDDDSAPLSNPSIAEWNRRNNPNFKG